MLLRSSSTPILGSLISSSAASSLSMSDSPSNIHQPHHHHHHGGGGGGAAIHCSTASAKGHFSPVSDHSDHSVSPPGFRRTNSEGSLRSLLPEPPDDHRRRHHSRPHSHPHPPMPHRRSNSALETAPFFSIYSPTVELVEENDREEEEEQEESDRAIVERIEGEKERNPSEGLNAVATNPGGAGAVDGCSMLPLFLARGLGIDRIGSGLLPTGGDCGSCVGGGSAGRGGGNCKVAAGSDGDQSDVESYYKRMVEEDPGNALFLRNYAQFLHQSKGDLKRAEEYLSRAILADPSDGEVLSQYAKLVWELHRDEERASSYFEQAVQVAPHDSHVLAAYAGFLWETEETDGDQGAQAGSSQDFVVDSFRPGTLTSATA